MPKKQKTKKKNNSVLYGTVTVGTKGQFVIPIEARKKLKINSGDQLLIFGSQENEILAIVKAEDLAEILGDLTSL